MTADPLQRTAPPPEADKVSPLVEGVILVLLGVYVFTNPFPHKTAVELISFYLSTALALALLIRGRLRFRWRTPLTVPFGLFLAWSLLGLPFALNLENSLHDVYAHLIQYLVVFTLLVRFFHSRPRLEGLAWTFVLSAGLFALGVMVYFYAVAGNPLTERLGIMMPSMEFIPGFITYTSLFAVFLAVALLGGARQITARAILMVSLLGTAAATVLTQSRSAFVAVVLSAPVFFIRSRTAKWTLLLVLILGLAMVPAMKDRFSGYNLGREGRLKITMITLEVIKAYPLTGIGFGMLTYGDPGSLDLAKFNARLPEKYRQHNEGGIFFGAPHNSYLDIAVRTGLVGLILWLSVLFVCGRMSWQVMTRGRDDGLKAWGRSLLAALVAIAVQDLFMDGTYGPQVTVHYILFAMTTVVWHLNEPPLPRGDDMTKEGGRTP